MRKVKGHSSTVKHGALWVVFSHYGKCPWDEANVLPVPPSISYAPVQFCPLWEMFGQSDENHQTLVSMSDIWVRVWGQLNSRVTSSRTKSPFTGVRFSVSLWRLVLVNVPSEIIKTHTFGFTKLDNVNPSLFQRRPWTLGVTVRTWCHQVLPHHHFFFHHSLTITFVMT